VDEIPLDEGVTKQGPPLTTNKIGMLMITLIIDYYNSPEETALSLEADTSAIVEDVNISGANESWGREEFLDGQYDILAKESEAIADIDADLQSSIDWDAVEAAQDRKSALPRFDWDSMEKTFFQEVAQGGGSDMGIVSESFQETTHGSTLNENLYCGWEAAQGISLNSVHSDSSPDSTTVHETFNQAFFASQGKVKIQGATCINDIGYSCYGSGMGVVLTFPLARKEIIEVKLDTIADPGIGIVIGVSTQSQFVVPNLLSDRPFLWCLGYDGQLWDGGESVWKDVNFDPFQSGDIVGLKVLRKTRALCLFKNEEMMTQVAIPSLPRRGMLYPVFDLLGAKQVTFLPRTIVG